MKVNFKQSWLNLLKLAEIHKPEMLAGFGVSLLIAAVPLAVVATVQTCKKVDEKKKEINNAETERAIENDENIPPAIEKLPAKEVIKIGWKYYLPAVTAIGLGSWCTIASTKEGLKRTAAMAAAYQLSESALNEYRSATKDVVGDKKENEIQQKIMKDRMELLTDENGHVVNVYDTRDGTTLCFDYLCGRYFYSDIDYIKSQINVINATMLDEDKIFDGFVTLNDVYRAIGLPEAGRAESLVWRCKKEGLVKLRPSSRLVDDRPVWVLNFETPPQWVAPWEMNKI